MSVVVAVKTEKGYMLGADSQMTAGDQKNTYAHKIFKPCEDVVIGSVGMLTYAQALGFMDEVIPKTNLITGEVNTKLIYANVYPRIIDFLRMTNRLGENETPDFVSIIAYKDKAWELHGDGSVLEIGDVYAIGSGAQVALGSLESTMGQTARDRITTAIKKTCKNTIYVDSDIHILTTYKEEEI